MCYDLSVANVHLGKWDKQKNIKVAPDPKFAVRKIATNWALMLLRIHTCLTKS